MTKIISLFSGAGGLDLGFHAAGFDIAVAVEEDPACCATLRRNANRFSANLKLIEGDIRQVTSAEILTVADLAPLEAALVIGGPPCQSFSLAGLRKGMHDSRGQLVHEYIRVVRDTLPVGFVMENVKGMLNWSDGHALKFIENSFREPIHYSGNEYRYNITFSILNAASFGVPQYRERLFIVGNRIDVDFVFPEETHAAASSPKQGKIPYRTVWDAIGGLPPAGQPSKVAERVASSIKGRIEKHGY